MAKMTDVITLRLPKEEKARWRKLAKSEGMNLGDWIRQKIDKDNPILTKKPTPEKGQKLKFMKADPALISELAKVGNNLNQISRWCNTHKGNAETLQVIRVLLQIKEELEGIKDAN